MTNNPYLYLALGTTWLGLIAGYFAWARLRYWRLTMDFLKAKAELIQQAKELNALDDPALQQFVGTLDCLIANPRLIGWSRLLAIRISEMPSVEIVPAKTLGMNNVLEQQRVRVLRRIVRHLQKETIPGWVFSLFPLGVRKDAKV